MQMHEVRVVELEGTALTSGKQCETGVETGKLIVDHAEQGNMLVIANYRRAPTHHTCLISFSRSVAQSIQRRALLVRILEDHSVLVVLDRLPRDDRECCAAAARI